MERDDRIGLIFEEDLQLVVVETLALPFVEGAGDRGRLARFDDFRSRIEPVQPQLVLTRAMRSVSSLMLVTVYSARASSSPGSSSIRASVRSHCRREASATSGSNIADALIAKKKRVRRFNMMRIARITWV